MQTRMILNMGLLLCFGYSQAQTNLRDQYIKDYALLAVSEMERTGIPASVKLAQAVLESAYGTSSLAQESNNHFGIKCGSSWKGEGTYKVDDDRDSKGRLIPSCFRSYPSPEESFVAHSSFLQTYRRYESLFELDSDDYKGWAKGLKKAGYATSRTYHKDLISIIEKLDLDKYDRLSSERLLARMNKEERKQRKDALAALKKEKAASEATGSEERNTLKPVAVLTNNDVRYLVSERGESIESLAKRAGLPARTVIQYNEHVDDAQMLMQAGTRVYIQPKRKYYRGRDNWHVVVPDESMFDIAQYYGVDLTALLRRNRLKGGQQPEAGVRIKLRGSRVKNSPAIKVVSWDNLADQYRYSPVPPSAQQPTPVKDTTAVNTSDLKAIGDPFGGPPPLKDNPKPQVGELDFDGSSANEETTTSALFHAIKLGDTLETLAKEYKVSVEQLQKWNNLKDGAFLKPGERLRVR